MLSWCFREGRGEIEMNAAAADGAADLRIGCAQVAMFVVRQRLILRLFRQRMRDAVHRRPVLGEQHGEDEKQRQEQAGDAHGGATLTKPGGCGKHWRYEKNRPQRRAVR